MVEKLKTQMLDQEEVSWLLFPEKLYYYHLNTNDEGIYRALNILGCILKFFEYVHASLWVSWWMDWSRDWLHLMIWVLSTGGKRITHFSIYSLTWHLDFFETAFWFLKYSALLSPDSPQNISYWSWGKLRLVWSM